MVCYFFCTNYSCFGFVKCNLKSLNKIFIPVLKEHKITLKLARVEHKLWQRCFDLPQMKFMRHVWLLKISLLHFVANAGRLYSSRQSWIVVVKNTRFLNFWFRSYSQTRSLSVNFYQPNDFAFGSKIIYPAISQRCTECYRSLGFCCAGCVCRNCDKWVCDWKLGFWKDGYAMDWRSRWRVLGSHCFCCHFCLVLQCSK